MVQAARKRFGIRALSLIRVLIAVALGIGLSAGVTAIALSLNSGFKQDDQERLAFGAILAPILATLIGRMKPFITLLASAGVAGLWYWLCTLLFAYKDRASRPWPQYDCNSPARVEEWCVGHYSDDNELGVPLLLMGSTLGLGISLVLSWYLVSRHKPQL
jgi:hypothetical protein